MTGCSSAAPPALLRWFTQSLYTPDGEERPVGGWGFTIATEALENGDFLASGRPDRPNHPLGRLSLGHRHSGAQLVALHRSGHSSLPTPQMTRAEQRAGPEAGALVYGQS